MRGFIERDFLNAPSNKSKVKGIPDNSSRVIPRVVCTDGAAEIDFCVNTFEAIELNRRPSTQPFGGCTN